MAPGAYLQSWLSHTRVFGADGGSSLISTILTSRWRWYPSVRHLSIALPSAKSFLEMNLRHAAALALVGWYLMVPPNQIEELSLPFGLR